jgi:photosystem II stability/assembly factor-like uncharacterized protein
LVSTIDVWSPDRIYRTSDAGKTWTDVGARAARDTNGAEWLYFGSNTLSATGWMGDIEIDPWNPTRVLYVTGQGIWWSDDVVSGSSGPSFRFACDGLEETVPLDLVSPPEGASLISGLGDIAGFRHDDFAVSPAAGMFENPRFNNTNSLDFAEETPDPVVRVGTAGSGLRRGAYSNDGGTSITPFESEPEGSQGSGGVAISADGNTVVWAPRGTAPHWSDDLGAGWTACVGLSENSRIAADRVDPELFYAVSGSDVLVSDDAGRTFTPTFTFAPRGARLRAVFESRGEVWLHGPDGLYRSIDAGTVFERVPDVASTLAIAFGKAAQASESPTLFVSGIVLGEPGLFRSDDAGESWTAIHDEAHHFGYINQLAADRNLVGRVYLGTGGRGILYGDPR